MAFLTSNELFDDIFGGEPEKGPTELFMSELMRYLKEKTASPLAVSLGKHIENGGACMSFACREDVFPDIAEELYENDIPYAPIATWEGRFGFLVREKEKDEALRACNSVLERKGRTCLVISGREILERAAGLRIEDRSCVAIHGLTTGQARIMQEKYARYIDEAVIGLDRMQDGTMTLTTFSNKAIKKNTRGGPDLCTIYLETVLSSTGPNGIKNQAAAELRTSMENKLSMGFYDGTVNLSKTPLWIVGAGTQYVMVTSNGFTYGRAIANGNSVELSPYIQADVAQPDYRQMLVSFTQRIPYPMTTYNQPEVVEHFRQQKNGGSEIDILDTAPDSRFRMYARGEKQISSLIDTMITRKIQNDPIMLMDGRQHEKFAHYLDALKTVMKALVTGRVPEGYELSDVRKLREILDRHQMEGTMYEQCLLAMQEIEAVTITTTIERIADVLQRIGEEKEHRDREMEKQKEKRAARTRGRSGSGHEKE